MKNYLCKLSMTAALISSFTFSAPLFALEDGVVKGSYINLRAEPKFNSKIVGKKVRGDSYKVKFEQQNWVKIVFSDGIEGWIYKTLVENSGTATDENSDTSDIDVKTKATATASDTAEIDKNKSKESAQVTAKKETAKVKKDQKSEAEKPVLKQIKKEDVPEVMEVAGTAADLYDEAIKLYEARKYAEALDKNKAASKKAPKNAEILNNLANCHFKMGHIEDALETWKEALKIAPRNGKICNNIGIAYYQLDKNKDAIEYYKKAITFEPDFPDTYYNLASVYGYNGELEEAIKTYKKYLSFNPDSTMKKLAEDRLAYCEKHFNKKKDK